jgi:hypothetical protein
MTLKTPPFVTQMLMATMCLSINSRVQAPLAAHDELLAPPALAARPSVPVPTRTATVAQDAERLL